MKHQVLHVHIDLQMYMHVLLETIKRENAIQAVGSL